MIMGDTHSEVRLKELAAICFGERDRVFNIRALAVGAEVPIADGWVTSRVPIYYRYMGRQLAH